MQMKFLDDYFKKVKCWTWTESKDPYLNTILEEEWYAAGVPARRDIHLMVLDGDPFYRDVFPFDVQYQDDGSIDIELHFQPSQDTYDSARTFIRLALHAIEYSESPNLVETFKHLVQGVSWGSLAWVETFKMNGKKASFYAHNLFGERNDRKNSS